MENHIELLSFRLEQDLSNLEIDHQDVIAFSKSAFNVCTLRINELREFILNYKFVDSEEEIDFYKNQKPKFVTRQLFYGKIYKMECICKSFSKENKIEFYKSEIKTILKFYKKESKIFDYYKTENILADQYYFQRIQVDINVFLDENYSESDTQFGTSFDSIFNKIRAFEQVLCYLDDQIIAVENDVDTNLLLRKSEFYWTGDKNQMIELMNALIAARMINDGVVIKSKLAKHLEKSFNIELGDIYKAFGEMFKRKNRTQFMELLTDSLYNFMDSKDAL